MHAGKIESSARLKRVLELLRGRGRQGATTHEIIQIAHVCAVNSIAAEIRANGFDVVCKFSHRTEEGGSVFRYFLIEEKPGQGDLFGRTA